MAITRADRCRILGVVLLSMLFGYGCDGQLPSTPAPEAPNVTASAAASPRETAFERLENLKAERLSIMTEVALWKWLEKKPIEDTEREKGVLAEVARMASQRGLDVDEACLFFRDLMDAAKRVQAERHAAWRSDPPPADSTSPDMAAIRRRIDALTPKLLEAWGETRSR